MTSPQGALDVATRMGAVLMLVAIVLVFGLLTPGFLAPDSLANTIKQSSFIGIAAVGMVFVLLTAGIDLSVGSVMFLGSLAAGLVMRDADVGVGLALLPQEGRDLILAGAIISIMLNPLAFALVALRPKRHRAATAAPPMPAPAAPPPTTRTA